MLHQCNKVCIVLFDATGLNDVQIKVDILDVTLISVLSAPILHLQAHARNTRARKAIRGTCIIATTL